MTDGFFNWNGIHSVEPPALDVWRWSRSAATSADLLVEKALARADEELRSRADAYEDAESYGEAQYYLIEEPASFARSGLFCQLAGSFEFALLHLCSNAAIATDSKPIDHSARDIVLSRLRYLGDATGVNFTDGAQEVLVLTKLRNAFAHADGLMMSEDDRCFIERWIRNHQDLADSTGHAIRLEEGFVRHCIATYDRVLTDIACAVIAKMRAKTVNPRGILPPA